MNTFIVQLLTTSKIKNKFFFSILKIVNQRTKIYIFCLTSFSHNWYLCRSSIHCERRIASCILYISSFHFLTMRLPYFTKWIHWVFYTTIYLSCKYKPAFLNLFDTWLTIFVYNALCIKYIKFLSITVPLLYIK